MSCIITFISVTQNSSDKKRSLYMHTAYHPIGITMLLFPNCSGADTRATDKSNMNPFMIAVEKGHLDVVKAMMKKDPEIVLLPMGSGSTGIHWALEGDNRDAFFKVCLFHLIIGKGLKLMYEAQI